MNNYESFLNQIHNKTPALVTLLLVFKYSTSKSPFLMYLAVFMKLFGLVIVTSNFVISDQAIQKKYHLRGTFLLRNVTLFQILLKDIPLYLYQIICVLIYFVEIGFFVYIGMMLYRIKQRKYDNLKINCFGKFCFYFNMLLSQHVLELLSFFFFYFFTQQVKISTILYDDQYDNIPMLSLNPIRYYNLVYLILNGVVYIFVNCLMYYTFYVLNSSISLEDSPMKFRHMKQSSFSVVCQILFSLHYLEIFISGIKIGLFILKLFFFLLVIGGVGWYYYISIKDFEFNNWLGWLTKLILHYTMFSGVLEIFLYFSSYNLSYFTIIILMIIKLCIAILFTWLYYYLKYRFLLLMSSVSLYSLNEESSWPKEYFESFAYLINRLTNDSNVNDNNNNDNANIKDLVDVILNHEVKCSNADCECKLFKVFPHSTPKPFEFKIILKKRIGFLVETTFIRSEINSNLKIALLLSEYYSIFKQNSFMAYSILQSFLAINYNKMTFFDFIEFYSMQLYFISNCKSIYQKAKQYVKFSTLFNETIQRKNLKKLIHKYCENFTSIVNMKEGIESSIKYSYDDSGELVELSSKYLTKTIVNKIVSLILIQGNLYKEICKTFLSDNIKSSKIELYYQMYLFLSLFGKKIGRRAKKALNNLNANDKFSHLADEGVQNKLESYLGKYFKQNKKEYYVMIKCNKGFTIHYFSSD